MSEKPAPEFDAILSRAQQLAEERSERATTAHLLLALLGEGEKSTAGRLLQSLNFKETQLRAAMREVGTERLGVVGRVTDEARRLARQAGARPRGLRRSRTGGLHLLLALSREPESVANRCLVHLGHDTSAVGHAALGCLTGGGQKALASAARALPAGASFPSNLLSATFVEQSGSNTSSPVVSALPPGREVTSSRRKPSARSTNRTGAATGSSSLQLRTGRGGGSGARPSAALGERGPAAASPRALRLLPGGERPAGSSREGATSRRPRTATATGPSCLWSDGEKKNAHKFLAKYARDLNQAVREGAIDPLVGREREIYRIVDVLRRRRGNVPCLVGEPGVGKTAIVEGLARRLEEGSIEGLRQCRILQVQIGDLLAGTGVRGALSERLAALRSEVAALEGKGIVFLDEVHSLLAATGGAAGEGAQELRSAMAGGDFPCILTTTPDAYRRYIEQDTALERRLTRIDIDEPPLEETREILAAGVVTYAEHHGVRFSVQALEAALRLSQRYLTERKLPDKAFAVLDLAGARAQRLGGNDVTAQDVAEVVSELTGVPAPRLAASDAELLLQLEEQLCRRIVGHRANLTRIAEALRRNGAGLGGSRPVGSFLLLGPTGVGKTETARALAEALFPGGGGMSRFDMSELSEAHSVARLVGAPPGYVGYEAGGHLTETVRQRPYQVLLLDEIEKAHPKVQMLLLQLMEDGRLTDGRGRLVDFRQTIVIMTSNLGVVDQGAGRSIGFASCGESAGPDRGAATLEAARAALPPELWNRFDEVLYFAGLDAEQVAQVARLLLRQTGERLQREKGVDLHVDESVVELLLEQGGYDPSLGARPMRRAIQRLVEAPLADAVLRGTARPGDRVMLEVRQGWVETLVQKGEAEEPHVSKGKRPKPHH